MLYPKPKIKKHKRETVSTYTALEVLMRDKNSCRLCGVQREVQIHHIVYRSQDKTRINDVSNCITLCSNCHRLVHSNKKKYMEVLKQIIEKSN